MLNSIAGRLIVMDYLQKCYLIGEEFQYISTEETRLNANSEEIFVFDLILVRRREDKSVRSILAGSNLFMGRN